MRVCYSVVGLPLDGGVSTDRSVSQETNRLWDTDLADGANVRDLIARLELAEEQIASILVNGAQADRDHPLHDGDAVAFTGQIAGD